MMKVIQWYPGHMSKAKREVLEALDKIDLVIELRDARIPIASKNPLIDEIIKNKPRLVLLCKACLADPKVTAKWINYLNNENTIALDIDSIEMYNMKKIIPYANKALESLFKKRAEKGISSKQIKAMIVGIPNVGKSTLINVLAKRKSLPVGDKPGVTKAQAWLKVTDDFMLLDTPGILWPKFEDQMTGVKLAICGAIKEEILDMHEIAKVALEIVKDQYPKAILERYNIENANEIEVLDLIEQIGRRRGAITKGNVVDIDRSIDIFITDLQKGRLGRISYEYPEI